MCYMGDYLDDYMVRQAQTFLLTSMRDAAIRAGLTRAFDEICGTFLTQSILEQVASGPSDEDSRQTYTACVHFFRAAVQHDLKRCRRLTWSEAQQLAKLPATEKEYQVRLRQKTRLATGAVVPLVWAELVDVFMRANVDIVLSGVVQTAFSRLPDEKRDWRP